MIRVQNIIRGGLLLLLLASCDGGPKAGELVLELTTPRQDDGAIAFTVTAAEGVEIVSLAPACDGCQAFSHLVSATELRGVVIGELAAGAIARLHVSDMRDPVRYTVAIREVARRDVSLTSAAPYQLTPVAP